MQAARREELLQRGALAFKEDPPDVAAELGLVAALADRRRQRRTHRPAEHALAPRAREALLAGEGQQQLDHAHVVERMPVLHGARGHHSVVDDRGEVGPHPVADLVAQVRAEQVRVEGAHPRFVLGHVRPDDLGRFTREPRPPLQRAAASRLEPDRSLGGEGPQTLNGEPAPAGEPERVGGQPRGFERGAEAAPTKEVRAVVGGPAHEEIPPMAAEDDAGPAAPELLERGVDHGPGGMEVGVGLLQLADVRRGQGIARGQG